MMNEMICEKIGSALLWLPKTGDPTRLIVACCGDELEEMLPELMKGTAGCEPFALLSPEPVSWDSDYTPWPSDELPGRNMTGEAGRLYAALGDELVPEAIKRLPTLTDCPILGYSLGGLFAFWAALQSDSPFDAAASVSGALWYQGFADYAAQSEGSRLKRLYLSLGRKEAKVGRGAMSRVAESTEALTGLFEARLGGENVLFEWNNGNHFFEVPQRIVKAVKWLCR